MGPVPAFIRGLNEYKVELDSDSTLLLAPDKFWTRENPNRYSVSAEGRKRKVKPVKMHLTIFCLKNYFRKFQISVNILHVPSEEYLIKNIDVI